MTVTNFKAESKALSDYQMSSEASTRPKCLFYVTAKKRFSYQIISLATFSVQKENKRNHSFELRDQVNDPSVELIKEMSLIKSWKKWKN